MRLLKIIGVIIILIIIILGLLKIGNKEGVTINPITIIIEKEVVILNNYNNNILLLNGWENFVEYNNLDNRVLGTNYQENLLEFNNNQYIVQNTIEKTKLLKNIQPLGFFQKETAQKEVETYKQNKNKITKVYWHNQEKDPSKIGYIFTVPKTLFSTKPYFKIQLFAETNNPKQLKKVGYGMIIKGYDLYLPNNKILKNDYERIQTNEQKDIYIEGEKQDPNNPIFQDIIENKIIIKGTNYKNTGPYQIFYNQEKAIIIWGEFDYIDNLFKWEVFRPFFTKKESENTFAPLYIAILNEVSLEYNNNTYQIQSKEFNGNVDDLIKNWTF